MNMRIIFLTCVMTLALHGCGGGGATGGSDDNGTAISITTTNQQAVAAAAVDANIRDFSTIGTNQVVAVTGENSERRHIAFLSHLLWPLTQASPNTAEPLPAGVVPATETRQCISGDTGSGTIAVNYTDNGDDDVSAGDTMVITLNNCLQFSSNERLGGTISYVVTNVSGTPQSGTSGWSITANVGLSSFTVTANNGSGATTAANGNFTLTFTQNSLTQVTSVIAGASFVVRDSSGQVRWTNFAFTFVQDSSGAYTESGSGTLSTDALDGFVTVTLTNVRGTDPNLPTGGTIKIVGANSSLTLRPNNDGVNVTFDLDLANNGTTDASAIIAWSTFL